MFIYTIKSSFVIKRMENVTTFIKIVKRKADYFAYHDSQYIDAII